MEKQTKAIGVDTATILISDSDFYIKNNSDASPDNDIFMQFKVTPKKTYRIRYECEDTYNGEMSGEFIFTPQADTIILSDPCYWFNDHDHWCDILDKYDYFDKIDDAEVIRTGGDGSFEFTVTCEEMI